MGDRCEAVGFAAKKDGNELAAVSERTKGRGALDGRCHRFVVQVPRRLPRRSSFSAAGVAA